MTGDMLPFGTLPELLTGPWLYVLLAAVVVASGVPLLGLVIAAEPILMTVIVLAGGGRVSIVTLVAVAVAGSVLGDVLSYWLGRWFGPKLLRLNIFRRSRRRIMDAQQRVQRQGTMSALFIQRWIPPTRGLVPAVLGAAKKPLGEFVALSALAAAVWATVIVIGSWVAGPDLMLAMPAVVLLAPAVGAARRIVLGKRQSRLRGLRVDKPFRKSAALPIVAAAIGGLVMMAGSPGDGPVLLLAMPAVMLAAPALGAMRRQLVGRRTRQSQLRSA